MRTLKYELHRTLALVVLLLAIMVWMNPPALADTGTEVVSLNLAGMVGIMLSVVSPILVGAFTKTSTHPAVKAVALLFLSALDGLLTQFISSNNQPGFPWATAALTAFLSFVVAVASHFGVWKPTGTTKAVQNKVGPKDPPIPM